ncbi:extracellular solute-binding protein [Anaerolineales bacterium HSG6]|nr:extracellular solute-binding protein [Anaerolineales bacterium HSG6]MDM8532148.1 extracellular solute-binding protein [Anaerolineales bacterium HSG25]
MQPSYTRLKTDLIQPLFRCLIPLIVLLGLLPWLFSCQSSVTPDTELISTSPTPPMTATPRPSPTPLVIPDKTPDDEPIMLRLWVIEPISHKASGQQGIFIDRTIRTFVRNHPQVDVEEPILKKGTGKGGMLDFLRTSREVAPDVLPDLAIMNAIDLQQAYNEGLIIPLDNHLDSTIVQDLLPAARRLGTVDDKLAGLPISMVMEHLIHQTELLTVTPIIWQDILTEGIRYSFPTRGVNGWVNDVTLSQYFSAGGMLLDDQGVPQIDQQVLRTVLENYQKGIELGVIDPDMLQNATNELLWQSYLEQESNVSQVTVEQFLTDGHGLENSTFAAGPLENGDQTSIAITHGWVFVLVTPDEHRQSAAINFMEWFLSTSNNANWNNINHSIPARDSAYQRLARNSFYWQFLAEQLNSAVPHPRFPGYDQVGRILQQAVQEVMTGEASPNEAAANAIDALTH